MNGRETPYGSLFQAVVLFYLFTYLFIVPAIDDLLRVLRQQSVTPAGELTRQLGISPATLSRWVDSAAGRVVRIGRTRGARYALHDEIAGIGARWPVWEQAEDLAARFRARVIGDEEVSLEFRAIIEEAIRPPTI